MTTAVTALFKNSSDAAAAIGDLIGKGIPRRQISVVAAEDVKLDEISVVHSSKLPEGAAIGAGAGGAIGAAIAGFTAVGALAATGIGLIAAGPLVAAFAGAGAGALAGGALGSLVGLAIPENELKLYEESLAKGHVLVGVDPGTHSVESIRAVFQSHGAERIR